MFQNFQIFGHLIANSDQNSDHCLPSVPFVATVSSDAANLARLASKRAR